MEDNTNLNINIKEEPLECKTEQEITANTNNLTQTNLTKKGKARFRKWLQHGEEFNVALKLAYEGKNPPQISVSQEKKRERSSTISNIEKEVGSKNIFENIPTSTSNKNFKQSDQITHSRKVGNLKWNRHHPYMETKSLAETYSNHNVSLKNSLKIMIGDCNHVEGRILTQEKKNLLKNALETKIIATLSNSEAFKPRFLWCGFFEDIFHVTCADEQSLNYLMEQVKEFNTLWEGANLRARLNETPLYVWIPDCSREPVEIFKILKDQNLGLTLNTDRWTLYNRDIKSYGQGLSLGVDYVSFEEMKKTFGWLYYLLGQVKFRAFEDRPSNPSIKEIFNIDVNDLNAPESSSELQSKVINNLEAGEGGESTGFSYEDKPKEINSLELEDASVASDKIQPKAMTKLEVGASDALQPTALINLETGDASESLNEPQSKGMNNLEAGEEPGSSYEDKPRKINSLEKEDAPETSEKLQPKEVYHFEAKASDELQSKAIYNLEPGDAPESSNEINNLEAGDVPGSSFEIQTKKINKLETEDVPTASDEFQSKCVNDLVLDLVEDRRNGSNDSNRTSVTVTVKNGNI